MVLAAFAFAFLGYSKHIIFHEKFHFFGWDNE